MWNDILFPALLVCLVYLGTGLLMNALIDQLDKHVIQGAAPLDQILKIGIAFLLGAGTVTFIQFIVSLLRIPIIWTFYGFIPLALVGYFFRIKEMFHSKPHTSLLRISVWLLLIGLLFFFFTRSFSRTMYAWDTVAFWMPKMFALWQDKIVQKETFEFFNHPEYPLLLPMTGATVYTLYNAPNEVAVKVALFGFTVAFVCILEGFLHRTTSFPKKAFFLVLMLSIFIFREHIAGEYVGTADIFVGMYIFAGAAALLSKRVYLALSLWSLVPWAKSEGMVWMLSSAILIVFFYWKDIPKKFLGYFLIPLMASFTWSIYNKFIGISSQYFKFNELYARPWAEYAVYSVHAFREEFRNLEKWNLLFFFFFASVLTRLRIIVRTPALLVIMLSLVAQVVSYMVIFTIAPEEQATFIAAAISRLTLHVAPTMLLVAAYLFGKETKEYV